jgi:hypothetical protein
MLVVMCRQFRTISGIVDVMYMMLVVQEYWTMHHAMFCGDGVVVKV